MGTFNTLTAETTCPNCKKRGTFEVQFKYGDTWQFNYTLGQELRWGGYQIGEPGHSLVRLEGIGGPCPNCNKEFLDFEIVLSKDVIVSVEPVEGEHNETSEGYIIVEP